MNKQTLTLCPVNGGPFNCLPSRTVEIESERILCNDVTLPWDFNPHNTRLYVIGAEHGPFGAVWANHEQDAFDELIDAGLGDALLVSNEDQANATPEEQDEWARLGNAGEPCDLTNVWIQQVELNLQAHNCRLLCAFAEARGANQTTLDN